jgi:hypothetical protein
MNVSVAGLRARPHDVPIQTGSGRMGNSKGHAFRPRSLPWKYKIEAGGAAMNRPVATKDKNKFGEFDFTV